MTRSPIIYYPRIRCQNRTPLVRCTVAIPGFLLGSCEEIGYNVSHQVRETSDHRAAAIGYIDERLFRSLIIRFKVHDLCDILLLCGLGIAEGHGMRCFLLEARWGGFWVARFRNLGFGAMLHD